MLCYPYFSRQFSLRTDASKQGLGAVLCQEQPSGDVRVVAYGSRTSRQAEENYSTHKLEFLALYWAVTKQFHHWPGMSNDVVEWIAQCQRCTCAKAPSLPQCAPLENIITSQPMEMVGSDFFTLEDGRGGAANVLVMTDHFTKFAMAVPTTNQMARTTACVFFDSFIVHYGFPS